ncbi:hypothetical protein B0H99_104113 [Planomicrobium soli]|uniref:Yip1 domain-containing protein n=1 Tax=Planomicrobium soli TaxID=1176648 RepID=A0A2P8H353_9BACL|nr:hypothetical protein [Planomicrobium soli]PSL40651.1 hypothetical protein B0H99_104113 [Planomicrobium soli]
MIFDFRFWHYFGRQGELIHNLQNTEVRNFNRRLAWILALGVLVFALREIWGMNTASLTPLFAAGMWDEYTLARWTSLVGTLLWAGLYLTFHSYITAFLFSKWTKMTWRAAIVMQSYVVAVLVIEKALVFLLFVVFGFTTTLSMFSFGPMAATFIELPNQSVNHFLTYFFNQLTIFTALIIAFQYRYVRSFTEFSPRWILFILLTLHILVALFVASFSLLPLTDMLRGFTEGGTILE